MGESGVGAESPQSSTAESYEPEAALAFASSAAGVSPTVAGEVLRARDLTLMRDKCLAAGAGSVDQEPTAEELLAWTVESLGGDSASKDGIVASVFVECGIGAETTLSVLGAEVEYMRGRGLVDAETARSFRDWVSSRECALVGPISIRGQ